MGGRGSYLFVLSPGMRSRTQKWKTPLRQKPICVKRPFVGTLRSAKGLCAPREGYPITLLGEGLEGLGAIRGGLRERNAHSFSQAVCCACARWKEDAQSRLSVAHRSFAPGPDVVLFPHGCQHIRMCKMRNSRLSCINHPLNVHHPSITRTSLTERACLSSAERDRASITRRMRIMINHPPNAADCASPINHPPNAHHPSPAQTPDAKGVRRRMRENAVQ